jgi:hypothetical protein
LPAQGRQATAGQLRQGAADPDQDHRGIQRYQEGFHRRGNPQAHAQGSEHLSPDHKSLERQLPCFEHPGDHELIKAKDIGVIVYEPVLKEAEFYRSRVVNDLAEFKTLSDVIVANRVTDDIRDVAQKFYTRDLLGVD